MMYQNWTISSPPPEKLSNRPFYNKLANPTRVYRSDQHYVLSDIRIKCRIPWSDSPIYPIIYVREVHFRSKLPGKLSTLVVLEFESKISWLVFRIFKNLSNEVVSIISLYENVYYVSCLHYLSRHLFKLSDELIIYVLGI